MKKVTGVITQKYTSKGVQPLNGKLMFFDFPFPRPIYYYFRIDGVHEVEVSHAEYDNHQIGHTYTGYAYELWDDLVIGGVLIGFLAVAVILILGFLG